MESLKQPFPILVKEVGIVSDCNRDKSRKQLLPISFKFDDNESCVTLYKLKKHSLPMEVIEFGRINSFKCSPSQKHSFPIEVIPSGISFNLYVLTSSFVNGTFL